MWAPLDTLFSTDPKKSRKVKLYIALTVYIETLIAIGVVLNVSLLKNVKQKTKYSSAQAFKSLFNKNNNHYSCYPFNFVFAINDHFCYIFTHQRQTA